MNSLSTYLAVKKLRSATKASCGLVTSGYSLKGGMSGGTFNTLLVISKQAKDAQKAAVLRDPYSLSPGKFRLDGGRLLPYHSTVVIFGHCL